jgi:hypothetical protein
MHQPESSAVLRATAATSAAPKEHVLAHEHLLLLAVQLRRQDKGWMLQRG